MKKLIGVEEVDINKELNKIALDIIRENSEKDMKEQKALIKKWSNEQETELQQQVQNFLINEKRKMIIDRLNKLERQEEILTFFDNRDKIRMFSFNKGFPRENPTDIPIEPMESEYSKLAEKHFKTWRRKNKPARLLVKTKTAKLMEESLAQIYPSTSNTV